MNLDQWSKEVAEHFGVSRAEAKEIVLFISSRVRRGLAEGSTMRIRGLGEFSVQTSRPRPNAMNPKTRQPVAVGPRKRVLFRPSTTLRRAVSGDA